MRYEVCKIVKTHGLKGEVVVKKTTDFERFQIDKELYIINNNQQLYLKIKKIREANKGLLVTFYNYEDINLIEKFRGCVLYTDEKPELAEDEYHYQDIIGKKVYNEEQVLIGEVSEIMEVPQGHILKIKTGDKTALIPFNDVFIVSVAETIVINQIEGLL